jgi:acyl-CoA thioesterase YciA
MDIEPKGELAIRVVAMPKDTNPAGEIFGGWLLSQMDLAGGVFCRKFAKGRVVTVTIDSATFNAPVFIGDTLCCYVSLVKIGRTSITTYIEAYVNRDFENTRIKVTEGEFKYVKMDENRKPAPINHPGL